MLMYGYYKITPEQFYRMSVQDVNEMLESYNQVKQAERMEKAYWVHCIMSSMTKKAPSPKTLMKPFLPKVKKQDSAAFFEEFERQRKGEENGR